MNASLKPPSFTTAPKRSSIWGRISAWRARRRASPAWTVAVAVIFALALLPVAAIAVLAISPTENIWPHLLSTVLPRAFFETVTLMVGVAALTLIVGAGTADPIQHFKIGAIVDRRNIDVFGPLESVFGRQSPGIARSLHFLQGRGGGAAQLAFADQMTAHIGDHFPRPHR